MSIVSAKPCNVAKAGNLVGYSTGTSDAAALISHEAVCFWHTPELVLYSELHSQSIYELDLPPGPLIVPNIKRVQEYAKNRITLIGYGELVQDTAALYELPSASSRFKP